MYVKLYTPLHTGAGIVEQSKNGHDMDIWLRTAWTTVTEPKMKGSTKLAGPWAGAWAAGALDEQSCVHARPMGGRTCVVRTRSIGRPGLTVNINVTPAYHNMSGELTCMLRKARDGPIERLKPDSRASAKVNCKRRAPEARVRTYTVRYHAGVPDPHPLSLPACLN